MLSLVRPLPLISALAALVVASSLGACSIDGRATNDGFLTNGEACQQCQAILVECSSTSKNEQEFVECRDQWLECQRYKTLGPDECANPDDADACSMCRVRLEECKSNASNDAATCGQQFDVCKAFLITRSDVAKKCAENEQVPPEVACGVCHKDLVTCLSDGSGQNTLALCDSKFQQCKTAHALAPEPCGLPTAQEACKQCAEHHASCEAAAGPDCLPNYDACITWLAPEDNCQLPTAGGGVGSAGGGGAGGAGEGGASEGGSGGAGGGEVACVHSECEEGEKLDASCSDCAQIVCQQDSFCCETEWDQLCADAAVLNCTCGS